MNFSVNKYVSVALLFAVISHYLRHLLWFVEVFVRTRINEWGVKTKTRKIVASKLATMTNQYEHMYKASHHEGRNFLVIVLT